MIQSRTQKSLKNSTIALLYYAIFLIINFFSRKIFLDHLGTEILGLNTTASNLLQFLNLAELGISTAVGFTLYKPLAKDDRTTINEVITLQGQLYKRIAILILLASAILMCFFPLIFEKIKLPMWYAYASFGVLLFSAMLGYFFNYRQIILSASQQDYKILYSFKTVHLIKNVAQMVVIANVRNGYVWWLILEAVFGVIATIALHYMTNRTFPWLKNVDIEFYTLRTKYKEFTIKIKQLFIHKIGTFALTQSSPLIIYAYTSLTTVALYGNYIIIVTGVQQLISSIFNSLTAGVGNLVSEDDKNKIWRVFDELFSIRFYIAAVICFVMYMSAGDFIGAWIGSEYILPNSTLFIIVAILFINMTRFTVETFINAYGLYKDIFAPFIEAIFNVGLSILFGYYYGLNGVLCGVLFSLIGIVLFWKPYFLFTNHFKGKLRLYVVIYIKHLVLFGLTAFISYYMIDNMIVVHAEGWARFIYQCLYSILIFGLVYYCSLYFTKCGLLRFTKRMINYVHKQ